MEILVWGIHRPWGVPGFEPNVYPKSDIGGLFSRIRVRLVVTMAIMKIIIYGIRKAMN